MSTHPLSAELTKHLHSGKSLAIREAHQLTVNLLIRASRELDRLHALEAKLEEVAALPGKWRDPKLPDRTTNRLATELESALASTGPSLRERVQAAVKQIRERADGAGMIARSYALEDAADLVQAALEVER